MKNRVVDGLSDTTEASNKNSREASLGNDTQGGLDKIYNLRHEIQALTLKMQVEGIACTGMDEDENCKDQSQVIQGLEGIKFRAEDALRNVSQHLTTKNIVDVKKRQKLFSKKSIRKWPRL